ncbi:hypothetical protein AAG906_028553 [Vitis piasezkii]
MMTLGGSRAIITLRAVAERGPRLVVVITCKTCLLQSMIRTIIPGWHMLIIRMCHPDVMFISKMSANQEVTSPGPCGAANAKKSVDKLSVKEFRERFCIPNGVFVELTDGEAVSIEDKEDNTICFSKEQFHVGLQFPLPSLFKEFLHFT